MNQFIWRDERSRQTYSVTDDGRLYYRSTDDLGNHFWQWVGLEEDDAPLELDLDDLRALCQRIFDDNNKPL